MPEEKSYFIGRYGRLRFEYIKHHRQVLYANLKTTCKLYEHLDEIDHQACEMVNLLTSQMATAEGITETPKASNQMAWIGVMNDICNPAEEIALKEIIYC